MEREENISYDCNENCFKKDVFKSDMLDYVYSIDGVVNIFVIFLC